MKTDGSFKILIGDGWRSTTPSRGVSPFGGGEARLDPSGARGSLDLEVDGNRLLGRPDEDSVFFLMRDLLSAVERLSPGDATARVSFYESPFELVIQRLGAFVYLTFYRGGHSPEVLLKDQPVPFPVFARGVKESAADLLEKARRVDSGISTDPLVAWMKASAARIDLPEEEDEAGRRPRVKKVKVESTRWKKPRNESGFSFGFRFLSTGTDLLAPAGPMGNDLNSLLFRGQLAVHARGRRRLMGQGFLFLQTEKLLASVRKLLEAWEDGRPTSLRLISEGLVVGVKLSEDDNLIISLLNQDDEDSILVINDMTPWEYADAVLGVAREVRRLVIDQAPKQRKNIRLESFSREVRTLAAWSREQRRGALINEDTEQYRRATERRRRDDEGREINEASRLTFRERWRLEAEGLDLGGTMLCGGIALVSARGFMLGVDTETGAVLWRRETDRSEARTQMAGKDAAVRVAPSGTVEMVEMANGVLRWKTSLAARSGGSPVLLVVDHGPVPGVVIVAEEERRLVALDIRTGEPRWKHSVPRGGRFALRRHGRLLYVASNDSQLVAIDLEDGSLVWRFPERTRFGLPPALEGDTLLVPGGRFGKQEGRIFALDAFSGELRWKSSLDGGALTTPIIADNAALVPVRAGSRSDLVALDVVSGEVIWRQPCDGWAETCALMALDRNFVVNAAGGVMRSIVARTGEESWTTVLGPACSDDVPLNLRISLRGGVLFVPADTIYVVRPDDGHVIHSLGGDPPVPDLLQVDPSCTVFMAEESGHIAMYELARRFSVVDGGA